jgi:hypothetical protein
MMIIIIIHSLVQLKVIKLIQYNILNKYYDKKKHKRAFLVKIVISRTTYNIFRRIYGLANKGTESISYH